MYKEHNINTYIFYVLILQGKLIEIEKMLEKTYLIVNRIVAPVFTRSISYREVPISWCPNMEDIGTYLAGTEAQVTGCHVPSDIHL